MFVATKRNGRVRVRVWPSGIPPDACTAPSKSYPGRVRVRARVRVSGRVRVRVRLGVR